MMKFIEKEREETAEGETLFPFFLLLNKTIRINFNYYCLTYLRYVGKIICSQLNSLWGWMPGRAV